MPCSKCGQKRTMFEVKLPNGKVVYSSTSKSSADQVATRYPGSTVETKAPAK